MATAVAAVMPSCVFDRRKKQASVSLNNLSPVTGDQEETLAAITETILPETEIPGAKSIAAHLFVFKMVDDCYPKEAQDNFIKGLDEVNAFSDERFGKSFIACSPQEREEILKEIDAKKESDSGVLYEFFKITKRHTIQGFMTCEYVMTKIQGYQLVPGRFNGCVEISKK
jgi:hypothetical protein